MWHEGTLSIGEGIYRYCVKSFGEGSEHGIDGGRISKLMIKRNGRVVCNYDRGWDIKPIEEETCQALESLKATYN